MDIATWNISGLKNPVKGLNLEKSCGENQVSLLKLLITRVNHFNEDIKQRERVSPSWYFFNKPCNKEKDLDRLGSKYMEHTG